MVIMYDLSSPENKIMDGSGKPTNAREVVTHLGKERGYGRVNKGWNMMFGSSVVMSWPKSCVKSCVPLYY